MPYFLIFWCEKNVHEALSFCILKRIKGIGGVGVWVLGVRLRMRGVFTTTNAFSRFFILWLGIAPNFSFFFCEVRSAGCWARQKMDLSS